MGTVTTGKSHSDWEKDGKWQADHPQDQAGEKHPSFGKEDQGQFSYKLKI